MHLPNYFCNFHVVVDSRRTFVLLLSLSIITTALCYRFWETTARGLVNFGRFAGVFGEKGESGALGKRRILCAFDEPFFTLSA